MIERPWAAVAAFACLVAALVWARSTSRLQHSVRRIRREVSASSQGVPAAELAAAALRKEAHTTLLYAVCALALAVGAASDAAWADAPLLLLLVPVAISLRYGRSFVAEARLTEQRAQLERRAEEVLAQEDLAPNRWAARLAPHHLPDVAGFELGQVYEAGDGAMAGDFYDVFPLERQRLAAVIGDVAGHGIEPSITAFQVKYLLRVFLRQYRDPAQALEELNQVLSTQGRPEELVSLCAVVFDPAAGTLRFTSAGHPAAWVWHDGEVRPLRSTGPLLTLDPHADYASHELPLAPGDLLLLYTDGLAEARAGGQLFGEERIGAMVRRDPGQEAAVLCKTLLEAARDFATGPLTDDVAILAIRRT